MNALGDGAAAYRSPDERQRVVAVRFAGDRDCWLLTQDPANGPYAIPLSFIVSGQHALMATASASRTVKNVEIDPRAALVLGGYGDAIRAYGRCAVLPLERVGRELRSSYVMKTGWDPERSGSQFVGLLLDMEKVLCSRSPTEDGDNVVWARDQPTPW